MPCLVRGDWIHTTGPLSKVVLKFYSAPPRIGGYELDAPRVSPHPYIGPVHDVDHSGGFATVLVPHPTTGQLAWTNIWRVKADVDGIWEYDGAGCGTGFAQLVSNNVLASWFRHGFENPCQVWIERNGVAIWADMLSMGKRHQLNVRLETVRDEYSSCYADTRLPTSEHGGSSSASGDRFRERWRV
ncbi:hypothetical protein N9L68_04670 [bacterium]|nr:hypothetical protein [bacterium]